MKESALSLQPTQEGDGEAAAWGPRRDLPGGELFAALPFIGLNVGYTTSRAPLLTCRPVCKGFGYWCSWQAREARQIRQFSLRVNSSPEARNETALRPD
jgi:hypothetical protein